MWGNAPYGGEIPFAGLPRIKQRRGRRIAQLRVSAPEPLRIQWSLRTQVRASAQLFSRKHSRMSKGTPMRSLNRRLFLILLTLLALSYACSSGHFPEQRVSASTSNVPPQENSTSVTAIVKTRKAKLRQRPSASSAVVTTVNKGDLLSLTTVRPTGPWYQVRDSKTGSEAWIHGNAIDLLQTAQTTSATTAPAPERPRRVTTPVSGKSYVNVDGVRVRSPVFSDTKPEGASARCRDGSYSFSLHRRGTCSHHGGVAEWY